MYGPTLEMTVMRTKRKIKYALWNKTPSKRKRNETPRARGWCLMMYSSKSSMDGNSRVVSASLLEVGAASAKDGPVNRYERSILQEDGGVAELVVGLELVERLHGLNAHASSSPDDGSLSRVRFRHFNSFRQLKSFMLKLLNACGLWFNLVHL